MKVNVNDIEIELTPDQCKEIALKYGVKTNVGLPEWTPCYVWIENERPEHPYIRYSSQYKHDKQMFYHWDDTEDNTGWDNFEPIDTSVGKTLIGYLAKDDDGDIEFYKTIPKLNTTDGNWSNDVEGGMLLSDDFTFPEITDKTKVYPVYI